MKLKSFLLTVLIILSVLVNAGKLTTQSRICLIPNGINKVIDKYENTTSYIDSINIKSAKDDPASPNLIRRQNQKYVLRIHQNKIDFPFVKRRIVAYAGMQYNSKSEPKIAEMVSTLKGLGVNCYSYLIENHSKKELELLPQFCKLASENGIEVWVTLVPPTEEPGQKELSDSLRYPPFGLNYIDWAKAISKISKAHSNLTLFMIDDFAYNIDYLTPQYMKQVSSALKSEKHKLLLGVTIYKDQLNTEQFNFSPYKKYINAVEWGYQHKAKLFPNYGISASSLPNNINDFRRTFPNAILIPCIYFLPHSSWSRKATITYLNDAMNIAYREAGTFLIYRTPKPGSVHFNLVKNFCRKHS